MYLFIVDYGGFRFLVNAWDEEDCQGLIEYQYIYTSDDPYTLEGIKNAVLASKRFKLHPTYEKQNSTIIEITEE